MVTQAVRRSIVDDRTDAELLAQIKAGDEQALSVLLHRYSSHVTCKARAYYFHGADRDDVIQEGMIGLYKAIKAYNPEIEGSFHGFADLCICRQMFSAMTAATRQKHLALNGYVSFDYPMAADDDDHRVLADTLTGPVDVDPAEIYLSAERIRALQTCVDTMLTDLEADVLRLHLDGRSYPEIAELVRRHTKAVDNALQRAKRKLQPHR